MTMDANPITVQHTAKHYACILSPRPVPPLHVCTLLLWVLHGTGNVNTTTQRGSYSPLQNIRNDARKHQQPLWELQRDTLRPSLLDAPHGFVHLRSTRLMPLNKTSVQPHATAAPAHTGARVAGNLPRVNRVKAPGRWKQRSCCFNRYALLTQAYKCKEIAHHTSSTNNKPKLTKTSTNSCDLAANAKYCSTASHMPRTSKL